MASCAAAVLAVAALFYIYIPTSEKNWRAAICGVKAKVYYALPLGRTDTLYISFSRKDVVYAGYTPDSLGYGPMQTGCFVSNVGHILTTDTETVNTADSLSSDFLKLAVLRADTLLRARVGILERRCEELDYYAATHSVVDDGYNEVMAYRERAKAELHFADSTLLLLNTAVGSAWLHAIRRADYQVKYRGIGGYMPAREEVRQDRLVLLKTLADTLPAGASRFSVYRFGTHQNGARIVGLNHVEGCTEGREEGEIIGLNTMRFQTSEGAAFVNGSGHLCGVLHDTEQIDAHTIARILRKRAVWPVWWIRNAAGFVRGLMRASAPAVQTAASKPCVQITVSDTLTYRGNVGNRLVDGRKERKGYGQLIYPDGTIYKGVWQADTLAQGTCTGRGETYEGAFDRHLRRHGQGSVVADDGSMYYSGTWKDGKRNGHGFSLKDGVAVRCGEWKADRFKGERMVYTADRVYGIDISRHQHEKGRKRFRIDWTRMRITSLGQGRRIQGTADYPVSFIYIKATEGKSIRNKYYPADLRAARARGIPVGSYHFFSAKSTAAEQAKYFLSQAWIAKGDMPPVLDLEPTERQVAQMGGETAMFAKVREWVSIVEKRCGKRPVLYVGQQFVNKHLVNAPEDIRRLPVWIARYGEYKPYVRLLHWQLTPNGRVSGIQTEVDINVFNGTKEQFAAMRAKD